MFPLYFQALEYQRTLTAKQASFGISLNYSCVICLHLAAVNLGKNVAELKWMVRIAGAKSKPHYLQTYQNAEKVLQITSLVSIQEVCVQVTASHLAESAASVMTSYEDHLVRVWARPALLISTSAGRCIPAPLWWQQQRSEVTRLTSQRSQTSAKSRRKICKK